MKKNLLFILSIMMLLDLPAQKISIEHLSTYMPSVRQFGSSSVLSIQHRGNWDTELRHNYDMERSFSFNAGRSFEFGDKISVSVKPMIGVVIGPIKGLSLNIENEMEWDRLYFSLQLQCFDSFHDRDQNFLYSWLEGGINFSKKFFGGISVQGNFMTRQSGYFNKGFVVGFSHGRWSFPVYFFDPFSCKTNIVAGILCDINLKKD